MLFENRHCSCIAKELDNSASQLSVAGILTEKTIALADLRLYALLY
jgi:hypothetical protein